MIVVVYYALQLSEVQSALAQKATKWLGNKLGSEVTVGNARISWLDEITLEDINIKDLKGRDMIFVRELYVNCKTNFKFNTETYIEFDNNLDYVLLKNPEVKLVKEKNGHLNIDDWLAQIERMTSDSTKKVIKDHNTAFTIDNAYIKNGFVRLTDSRKKRSPENLFDTGEAAHAAVSPHLGRNALDAAVLGYMNIAALRQHILPTERIHGIFLKGGEKPNIVPREAEMDWYVRSNTIETLQPLKERVAGCLHGGAHAAGCHVDLQWQPNPFADIVDNIPLLAAYVSNSAQFGRMLTTEYMAGTGGGSTDMGNISYLTPSIHPMIAVAPEGVSLHTPEFADYATNEEATRAILDGAKIMAMTAIDVWTNDALAAEIKAAFGDGFVPEGVL